MYWFGNILLDTGYGLLYWDYCVWLIQSSKLKIFKLLFYCLIDLFFVELKG